MDDEETKWMQQWACKFTARLIERGYSAGDAKRYCEEFLMYSYPGIDVDAPVIAADWYAYELQIMRIWYRLCVGVITVLIAVVAWDSQ